MQDFVRNCMLSVAGLMVWTTVCLPQPKAQPGASGNLRYKVARKFIYPEAFQTGKPYTPGVLAGNTLYVSGQVDRHPKTGVQPKGIAEQTRMAMSNLGHVLRAAGMDYRNVVSCHVQLADMGNYKAMNEVYAS